MSNSNLAEGGIRRYWRCARTGCKGSATSTLQHETGVQDINIENKTAHLCSGHTDIEFGCMKIEQQIVEGFARGNKRAYEEILHSAASQFHPSIVYDVASKEILQRRAARQKRFHYPGNMYVLYFIFIFICSTCKENRRFALCYLYQCGFFY